MRATDLTELELPDTMKTTFPDPQNLLSFTLVITPDEGASARPPPPAISAGVTVQVVDLLTRRLRAGMYKGGAFNFSINISQNYPHEAPKVRCTQKIYHPNLDLEGNVCLWVQGDGRAVRSRLMVLAIRQEHPERGLEAGEQGTWRCEDGCAS